jgi:cell division protein FtsW
MIGLLFIYSASSVYALDKYGDAAFFLWRQLGYSIIGMLCCAVIIYIPFQFVFRWALVWWMGAFLVTASTLFFARPINGACRWFSVAGISIQPSEFLTIATLLYGVSFLNRHLLPQVSFFSKKMIPFLLLMGSSCYVLLAQPDFGSSVTMLMTIALLLFLAGISYRECLILFWVTLPFLSWLMISKQYRLMRLMTFLDPWRDPQGSGFQIIQSLLAIGSGKIFGVGLGLSRQKFFYLPMQHTDFIFSIIAEEIGFVGTFFLILLYIIFFYYGFCFIKESTSIAASLFIMGALSLMSMKAIVNMLVCIGLVPTKGLALPFVSYGGSGLIAQWILVGLIISAFFAKNEAF